MSVVVIFSQRYVHGVKQLSFTLGQLTWLMSNVLTVFINHVITLALGPVCQSTGKIVFPLIIAWIMKL